jgi:hypothetical protein
VSQRYRNPDGDRFVQRLTEITGFEVAGPGLLVRRDGSPEDAVRPTWNRQAPPAYIWTDELPTEWLRLVPHQEATGAVWAMMLEHRGESEQFVQRALDRFRDLGRVSSAVS